MKFVHGQVALFPISYVQYIKASIPGGLRRCLLLNWSKTTHFNGTL